MKIIAADIGGTSSRFALFEGTDEGVLSMKEKTERKTREWSSFHDLLQFLKKGEQEYSPTRCDRAVFAVAGPVQRNEYARPPNIRWDIDISELKNEMNIHLLNDFVAQAYGCLTRLAEELVLIKTGRPEHNAPLAVIGAGTGLGHSVITPDSSKGFAAVPSEAGHAPYAFVNDQELEYMRFVRKRTGKEYVYGDLVVSGRGLSFAHEFLTGNRLQPFEVAQILEHNPQTLELFSRFYARACRSYALAVVPLAGMCLTGGVAAKNPHLVQNIHFVQEFLRSPSQHHLLDQIPLFLNTNEDLGLWGAACRALLLSGIRPKQHFPGQ